MPPPRLGCDLDAIRVDRGTLPLQMRADLGGFAGVVLGKGRILRVICPDVSKCLRGTA